MLRDRIKNIRIIRELALRWRHWHSQKSFISGNGNRIQNKGIKIATRIQISGSDNTVVIEDDAVVRDCLIKISGNHNKVVIKKNAYIAGAELWIEDNSCKLTVGENTFVGHHSHLACTENNSSLSVGSDCMLSSYVQIRTGDSHSILDLNGIRINHASDVVISNHCWIGEGAKILKGTFLDSDLIVATGAVVKGTYPSNVIVAGNPAKVIKNNVTWDSRRL